MTRRWRGRPKGAVIPIAEDPKVGARMWAIRKAGWKLRPLYYMKGSEVHKGAIQSGKVVEGPEVSVEGDTRRGYKTASQTCMELTPSKAAQRSELAAKIDGGTVLELQAGKGNLSQVYAPKADKLVLVDQNQQALNRAEQKLEGKVKHETIAANNVEWLKDTVSSEQLKNLKLVDFDPFGSPADSMKAFFKRFPVKRKLVVAVTDGSKTYIGYRKGSAARRWLRENYGINLNASGTREDQIRVLDSFMQVLGRQHGFSVKPVNAGFGKQTAVYAGYELSPK